MDWRRQADAFYRSACERGLAMHAQVEALLRQRLESTVKGAGSLLSASAGNSVSSNTEAQPDGGCIDPEIGDGSCPNANGTALTVNGYWGIACSGGADSLALLLWLHGAAQNSYFGNQSSAVLGRLRVLHLDHGLRGEASQADAAFVAGVAAGLGLPLYAQAKGSLSGTSDKELLRKAESVTSTQGEQGGRVPAMPSEALLRQWRQDFFLNSGCELIFQGHHRGDVAETLLMRLSAGSGLEGMCAPRPVSAPFANEAVGGVAFFNGIAAGVAPAADGQGRERGRKTNSDRPQNKPTAADGNGESLPAAAKGRGCSPVYLRPLLDWDKAQIVGLLEALSIPWREDASNATGDYFRNRIRRDVLPALATAAGRDAVAGAAQTRRLLQEDAVALDFWLGQLWQQAFLPQLESAPPAGGFAGAASCPSCDSAAGVGDGSFAGALNWAVFASLPVALRRRALWRIFSHWGLAAAFTGAGVDALLAQLDAEADAAPADSASFEKTCIAGADGATSYASTDSCTAGAASVGSKVSSVGMSPGKTGAAGIKLRRFSAGGEAFLVYCPLRQMLWAEPAVRFQQAKVAQEQFAADSAAMSFTAYLAPGQELRLRCGGLLRCEEVALDEVLRGAIRAGQFSCERDVFLAITENNNDGGGLLVRYWKAGDSYRPLGAPGRRKVQDCFTDRKVPQGERHSRPVVADAQTGAILWVAGLPPAHEQAIDDGTKSALRLTYTPSRKTVSPYLI